MDNELSSRIRDEGTLAVCILCDNRRKCLDVEAMRACFEPIVTLYTDVVGFMPLEFLKNGGHSTLAEKLTNDWWIFDDLETTRRFLEACCEPFHPKDNPDGDIFEPDRVVEDEELFWDVDYVATRHLSDLWRDIKSELKSKNRFFAGVEAVPSLTEVLANAVTELSPKDVLFRVRSFQTNAHSKRKMGAPPPEYATAGRANPPGISYLYLASAVETAVAEVRPHVGENLCVGRFKLRRSVKVVDLRQPHVGSPFRWGDRLHAALRIMGFLQELGQELSRPVAPNHREHEYLATQYLCELLKTKGYDGVLYKSGLGKGYNLALFDPSAAYCKQVEQVRVTKLLIDFSSVVPDT